MKGTLITAAIVSFAAVQGSVAKAQSAFSTLDKIPEQVFQAAFPPGSPMAKGLNGANAHSWVSIGEQTGGMIPIDYAAVKNQKALADRFFYVIEAGFDHQRPDGSFQYPSEINGQVQGEPAEDTGAAFFLGSSAMAMMLLQQSPLATDFKPRIEAVIPRYRKSLVWLAQARQTLLMANADSHTVNRLFFDAEAFLLGNKFANVSEVVPVGVHFLDLGLAKQAPEGYFLEKDGPDTSYNAISCLELAQILLFVDEPRIVGPLKRSVNWELSRIHPDGRIDEAGNTRTGQNKLTPSGGKYGVDYPEVVRMFAVVGALFDDARAMDAAARIAEFHKNNPSV